MENKVQINNDEKVLEWKGEGENYHAEVDGIPFDGHRVLWSFSYEPKTYLKESELSGDEWRKGGAVKIFRNGICVYNEFCRTPERAAHLIQWYLPKLQEFSWEYIVVGRKLYDHDIPVIIESICADGEILVRTEDGSNITWAFQKENEKEGDFTDDWKDKDRVHVLSEHLYWHRK